MDNYFIDDILVGLNNILKSDNERDYNHIKKVEKLVYSVADLKNLYNPSIGEKMVKMYMFMMKQKCT